MNRPGASSATVLIIDVRVVLGIEGSESRPFATLRPSSRRMRRPSDKHLSVSHVGQGMQATLQI